MWGVKYEPKYKQISLFLSRKYIWKVVDILFQLWCINSLTLRLTDALLLWPNWVNFDSVNAILPGSTKPLPQSMLTNHQWWFFKITKLILKITYLKLISYTPEVNELIPYRNMHATSQTAIVLWACRGHLESDQPTCLVTGNRLIHASDMLYMRKICLTHHHHCLFVPWGWINIKMPSYQYRKSRCGDKTVVRSSYLHNGISYTGKMTSLYWIRALGPIIPTCINSMDK